MAEPEPNAELESAPKVQALEAELQQVKQRAVKKIRGLEEKLKATTAELEAERARTVQAGAEVQRLEASLAESQPLQAQVALLMQQELSLSQSLQSLQAQAQQQEASHERELSALTREVDELQEERHGAAGKHAASAARIAELQSALDASLAAAQQVRSERLSHKLV